jgi:scyllo-inositol 2-dehydrogenase (NADP+)
VDDFFELILFYDKIRVSLNASYLVKEAGPRYLLHGTNGSYVKYGLDPQEDALKSGIITNCDNWGAEKEENWGILHIEENAKTWKNKYETLHGNYQAFYENIYNTLTNNAELAVKAEEGLQVIRIIEAAWESSRKRKFVDIE